MLHKILYSLTFLPVLMLGGTLDNVAKGNKVFVEWDSVYVDRGDIKVVVKKKVYAIPALYTTGKKLYFKKKSAKYLCKAHFEHYYPLPTPMVDKKCSKH